MKKINDENQVFYLITETEKAQLDNFIKRALEIMREEAV